MTDKQKRTEDELTLKEKCMNSGKIAFPESAERATRCGNAVYGAVVYQLRTKNEESSGPFRLALDAVENRECIVYDDEHGHTQIVDFNLVTVCNLLNAQPKPVGHAGVFYQIETASGVIEEGIKNKLIEMGWIPPTAKEFRNMSFVAYAERGKQFDAMAAFIVYVMGGEDYEDVTQKASDLGLLKDFCLVSELIEAAKRHEDNQP